MKRTKKNVKRHLRKLYSDYLTKLDGCLIIEDETYVKTDLKQLPGKTYYVAKARNEIEKKYRLIATKICQKMPCMAGDMYLRQKEQNLCYNRYD